MRFGLIQWPLFFIVRIACTDQWFTGCWWSAKPLQKAYKCSKKQHHLAITMSRRRVTLWAGTKSASWGRVPLCLLGQLSPSACISGQPGEGPACCRLPALRADHPAVPELILARAIQRSHCLEGREKFPPVCWVWLISSWSGCAALVCSYRGWDRFRLVGSSGLASPHTRKRWSSVYPFGTWWTETSNPIQRHPLLWGKGAVWPCMNQFLYMCALNTSHCAGHNHSTNNFFAMKRGCYAFLHENSAQFCELQPVPVSPVSTKCQNPVTDPLLVRSKLLK